MSVLGQPDRERIIEQVVENLWKRYMWVFVAFFSVGQTFSKNIMGRNK